MHLLTLSYIMQINMSSTQKTLQELSQSAVEELKNIQESIKIENESALLRDCFKFCQLLKENLSAKEYYELFLIIFDGLSIVENFLLSKPRRRQLYNESQFFPEMIPRQYVIITVGISLYKQTKDAFFLKDILDTVKGVQHPLRGLFLRYYLNKKVKDLLEENSLESIRFVMNNLSEMNSLWARIDLIEEREALKLTVGENIERLSILCIDKELYLKEIFPKCVEIINESDVSSQQYLLDCIVQAFPDEFHLQTSKEFMRMACNIQQDADIIEMVISSLSRLYSYLQETKQKIDENCYDYMKQFLTMISSSQNIENIKKKIEIHHVIIRFSTNSNIGIENIFHCLETCTIVLENEENKEEISSLLADILIFPLDVCLLKLIKSSSFHIIFFDLLEKDMIKVAQKIAENIHKENEYIDDLDF